MGRNVFVSYKYADSNVAPLPSNRYFTTARDYVNELQGLLTDNGHKFYGEKDEEDLSYLSDDSIYEKLKNRMFPTSCTIVLISPNMKELYASERNQWIPWEIYYSLRETTRSDYTSRRNAILAVVLPDRNGSYDYALETRHCCSSGCIAHHSNWMFKVLKKNMFNKKSCTQDPCFLGDTIWYGEHSYIPMVKWSDFKLDINKYIERVEAIKDNASEYELYIGVDW